MFILLLLIIAFFVFKIAGKASPYIILGLLLLFVWTLIVKYWWIILISLILYISYGIYQYRQQRQPEENATNTDQPATIDKSLNNFIYPEESVKTSNLPFKINHLHQSLTNFVALDIKTADVFAFKDIIRISAIKVINNQPVDTFSTFVYPKNSTVDAAVTELTNITNEDVVNAPIITEVLPKLEIFIDNLPIVGYQINSIYLELLTNQGFYMPEISIIDLYDIAQSNLTKLDNVNFLKLKLYFGIDSKTKTSLSDCQAVIKIYQKLCDSNII